MTLQHKGMPSRRASTAAVLWITLLGLAASTASAAAAAAGSAQPQAQFPTEAPNAALPTDQGFRVGVERGMLDYRSVERSSSGGVTNQERGHLPVLAATVRWQSDAWLFQGRLSGAKNDVDYQGHTQIGIPLTTVTHLAVYQAEVRASYQQPLTRTLSWRTRVGLAHLRIDRNIQPGLGSLPLQEVLDSTRLMAGLEVEQVWPGLTIAGNVRPVHLSAGVEVLPALRNRLVVNSFGQFDPITLTPARQTDWRWNAKAQWLVTPKATLSLSVVQEHFQPGSSAVEVWRRNGVPLTGVRYPGSEQSLRRWTLGLHWLF